MHASDAGARNVGVTLAGRRGRTRVGDRHPRPAHSLSRERSGGGASQPTSSVAPNSGNLSAAESARIIVAAWPRIQAAVQQHAPPMLWTIARSGQIRPVGA